MRKLLLLSGSFFLFLFPAEIFATHIVGGELNYKDLGNGNYEIRLTVYRDCYNGVPPFDNPASIGIFDANNALVANLLVFVLDSSSVPNAINSPCLIPPTNICYRVAHYVDTVYLPPKPGGYQLAYQRCCRNNSIININNPGGTGATYYATIPDTSVVSKNNNPVFNTLPPTFICQGAPFTFDHSATDADGDSLVYQLCTPLKGGTSINPMPQPPNNPPYNYITWQSPYSLNNVLGGTPLAIDPVAGILTATPNTLGQFVYAICVAEYRNGVYIGETRRDFQVNVITCPNLIVSSIQSPTIVCGSKTAQFTNNSYGASTYFWDFGVASLTDDTSGVTSPSYTYPDTGYYKVMLVAYSGINPGCNDTSYGNVYIYPPLTADFRYIDTSCYSYMVSFFDSTSQYSGTPNSWQWNFGDGTISSNKNPVHTYNTPGTYNVSLLSITSSGCMDTVTHSITILPQLSAAYNIAHASCANYCDGGITVTPAGGHPPYNFLWGGGQTASSLSSLCPGTYPLLITDSAGCFLADTITILQTFSALISSINAATCLGICDGEASISVGGGTPPYTYLWSNGQTGQTATGLCAGNYSVTATDTNGCFTTTNLTVVTKFKDSLSAENISCFGECSGTISTSISGGIPPYTYLWNTGSAVPALNNLCPGLYYVAVTDSNNCFTVDSIVITQPEILSDSSSSKDVTCTGVCNGRASGSIKGGTTPYIYLWNDPASQSTSDAVNLCPGTYILTVTDSNGCQLKDTVVVGNQFYFPPVNATADDDSIFITQSTILHAVSVPGVLFSWSPPDGLNNTTSPDPVATPSATTTYTVTVTDSTGCISADTVTVKIIGIYCDERDIFVPNAFTPDQDGHNDILYVRGQGISELYFAVYSRWGECVFETKSVKNGWNGTYKGALAAPDVFVYYLRVKCYNGAEYFLKGNVTLIR